MQEVPQEDRDVAGTYCTSVITLSSDQPSPLFNKETDWRDYVLDSNCIAWMFEMSMNSDVIMTVMRLIPGVVWHAGINTTLSERP